MAVILFIRWRSEELGQLLDMVWPHASVRLLSNVLSAVLMESIGILWLHLVPGPHVTWTSSGKWGQWHIGCWRHWDRPGWFCGCMATCFSMVIRCCCSLKLSIWLLITAYPCLSLVPVSRVLKECSISCSSGDVVLEELADVVVWAWSVWRRL